MDVVIENAVDAVFTAMGDLAASTTLSFNNVVYALNKLLSAYTEREFEDLNNKIKDERSKMTEMEEAEEMGRVNDMFRLVSYALLNPLNSDWSLYASLYDKPYEPWSTKYHTGCSMPNNVSALWLADKKDGII